MDLSYLENVEEIILTALRKAPTDAKLHYNLGIIYFNTDREEEGFETLNYLIDEIRPNYHEARYFLAQRLESKGKLAESLSTPNYRSAIQKFKDDDILTEEVLNKKHSLVTVKDQVSPRKIRDTLEQYLSLLS